MYVCYASYVTFPSSSRNTRTHTHGTLHSYLRNIISILLYYFACHFSCKHFLISSYYKYTQQHKTQSGSPGGMKKLDKKKDTSE